MVGFPSFVRRGQRVVAQLPRSKGFFGQFRRVMLLFAALVPFQA
jgi:hypothetical protein